MKFFALLLLATLALGATLHLMRGCEPASRSAVVVR